MSASETTIIKSEIPGLTAHGIFKKGQQDLKGPEKPLLVLIHGSGCNASYFDNTFHS